MKKILSLIISLWCIAASAQVTPTGYLFRNTNERVRLGKFDGLHLPAYGTTGFVSGQYLGAGAIRLDTTGSDKGVYVWYDGVWNSVSAGALFGSTDVTATAQREFDLDGNNFIYTGNGQFILNNTFTSPNAKFKLVGDNSTQHLASFGDSTQDWTFDGSGSFAIRKKHNVAIAAGASQPENTFLVVRQMDLDSGVNLNGFYAGSRFLHEYRIRGSAKLRSEGNDFAMAAVAQLQIRKAEGFSGYSTIGTQSDNSIIQAVPALEGLLQMRGSTSSANGMRATGWWSAVAADLVKTANDTINNVAMFMTMGLNTGKVNRMVDYYAYLSGVSSNDTGYAFFAPFKSQRNLFQNITVGSDEDGEAAGRLNHPSAMVDFKSTTKGFLPMVMTTTQRDAIPSPATGLLIANSDSSGKLDYYNGSAWVGLGASTGSVGGSSTWNGITDPTGVQSLTFGNGEYTEWTNQNDAEVFIGAVNNSLTSGTFLRGTTSSMTSGNIFQASSTSTALASGNELLDLAMSGTNGTSGITATGARISVTNTGTTSTNIGLAVTASGASTNYAIDATGTVRTSTSFDMPSSTSDGLRRAGTVILYDNGSTGRWSPGGGNGQLFTSGSTGIFSVFNSGGSNSVVMDGTGIVYRSSSPLQIQTTGNVGIGSGVGTSATARLHISAGTATASTAPLKFTSGTNLTAAEAGAVEWDGTNLFITQTSGPTRKTIAYTTDIPTNASGTFTSTITNGTNVTSSTFVSASYIRSGNTVQAIVQVQITATVNSSVTTFDLSLPVASAFTTATQARGVVTENNNGTGQALSNDTNDRLTVSYTSGAASAGVGKVVTVSFQYDVL
jgi:hypothetical protein